MIFFTAVKKSLSLLCHCSSGSFCHFPVSYLDSAVKSSIVHLFVLQRRIFSPHHTLYPDPHLYQHRWMPAFSVWCAFSGEFSLSWLLLKWGEVLCNYPSYSRSLHWSLLGRDPTTTLKDGPTVCIWSKNQGCWERFCRTKVVLRVGSTTTQQFNGQCTLSLDFPSVRLDDRKLNRTLHRWAWTRASGHWDYGSRSTAVNYPEAPYKSITPCHRLQFLS